MDNNIPAEEPRPEEHPFAKPPEDVSTPVAGINHRKVKHSERNAERLIIIRKLKGYYALAHNAAQKKYMELRDSGELTEILAKIDNGERLDRPICPKCNGDMVKRTGRLGEFWGCLQYPNCLGTRYIASEIKDVTDAQKAETAQKLMAALDYIKAIGGVDEALRWVNIGATTLGEGKCT
jgi:hypothetical protein